MADMDPRTGKLERLTIRCACGYSVTWTKQAILAKAGAWRRPAELARALRCTVCGAKGRAGISGDNR
ncbi:hypothetical protein [uncultured Caulobacter sp.]|uniref:hypothetical protein n=1 Tax=uncultured Caulobacter sp. TaxID=158749 RepID=UPI00260F1E4E|nr:hypothetical protein [uncultured Caulobacter sp.]